MKKLISSLLALVMMFSLCIAVSAQDLTSGSPSGEVNVSLEIPAFHDVTVNFNDGGSVYYDSSFIESGTVLVIPRFGDVKLSFICDYGYRVGNVAVDGKDVTSDVIESALSIEHISDSMTIDITFVKDSSLESCIMSGLVVDKSDKALNGGSIVLDGDEQNAVSIGKDGSYALPEMTDGRHVLVISDKKGDFLGAKEFLIKHSSDADSVTITKNGDGTFVITIPSGQKNISVNLVVDLKDDSGNIDFVIPPPTEGGSTGGEETGSGDGSSPGSSDISDMGDNSASFAVVCLLALSLAVLISLRRKKSSQAL